MKVAVTLPSFPTSNLTSISPNRSGLRRSETLLPPLRSVRATDTEICSAGVGMLPRADSWTAAAEGAAPVDTVPGEAAEDNPLERASAPVEVDVAVTPADRSALGSARMAADALCRLVHPAGLGAA